MDPYKQLTGSVARLLEAVEGDTIAKMMDDIQEASTHEPHKLRPPVDKETLTLIHEIMDAYNEHRELSHAWEGK